MKLYLASRFSDQEILRRYAHEIFELGHSVTSRWLHERSRPPHMPESEWLTKTALIDWQDLSASDMLIRFVHEVSKTGGADTEVGIALEQRKTIWLVGPYRNVFHRLCDQRFDTWEEAKEALKGISA